ncbi:MAG: hypothetical protein HY815_28475 [Candidatus Riflebacteria bacterium]|nr:hypothetical protein [Candidatus Riflebacteria bacterium]
MIFDQPTRLSAAVGSFILGARSGEWLLALTQSIALAYLALQLWMRVSLAGPSWRKIVVVALALVHVAMVGVLMFEVISPVLTERPLHHCPYCLTKPHYHNTLATLAGLLLLGLATFIPLWLVWLGVVATPPTAVLQWWQTVSALGLVLFWSLVLVPYYYKLR